MQGILKKCAAEWEGLCFEREMKGGVIIVFVSFLIASGTAFDNSVSTGREKHRKSALRTVDLHIKFDLR